MTTVLGRNVHLYVYESGVPTLTVCGTNVSRREILSDKINITTVDSGRENEYGSGGSTDSELVLDGVRTLSLTTNWQADDWEIGEVYRVILIYMDALGNSVSYDGNVLITGIDDSNPADNHSTYSVTMLRSGSWTKLSNVPVGESFALVDSNGDYILDGNGDFIIVP
jgi:hypothetical protein